MQAGFATPLEMDGVGIDHRPYQHHQHPHHLDHGSFTTTQQPPVRAQRKRKADAPPENNERLSKRMSLLNLEQSGQKLYVPVEHPDAQPARTDKKPPRRRPAADDSVMQLDDSKHKVYIYNIDDELSSSDNESDAADGRGKLIFLPDIEKHLLASRIPTRVLDPRPDPRAELAGKELVLYGVPCSLSVPEEQDSVRKAIIEARARARERQCAEREMAAAAREALMSPPSMASSAPSLGGVSIGAEPQPAATGTEDPDAMELD